MMGRSFLEITGLAYVKKPLAENRTRGPGLHKRRGFDKSGDIACEGCFKKNIEIDHLRDQLKRLKGKAGYDVKKTGRLAYGPHMPSSKIDLKPN
jgi:hypothetical protein